MKKIGLLALSVILVFSLVACGCQKNEPMPTETTAATTMPATEPDTMPILPEVDPTLGTNIPDPEVDPTMPEATDTTIGESMTDSTNGTDDNNGTGGAGNSAMP